MAMARWSCDRETKNRARQHCHGGTIHDARNLTQDRRNTQMFTRKEAGRNIDQPGPSSNRFRVEEHSVHAEEHGRKIRMECENTVHAKEH